MQKHIPCSFTDKLVCIDNKLKLPVLFYRGKKCSQQVHSMQLFIGTMQFMNSSLDALIKNLSDNDLSQKFSGKLLGLVKQKVVYPYGYINSFKGFFDDGLSGRREFYSSLKDKCIINKDYLYVVNAWNKFEMKTMVDYHDLYLKIDVLLLANVFETLVGVWLEYYGLDHSHCSSSPRLSWNEMLKMTGVELELISDINIHLRVEKVMGGAISYITKRYSKANNKYMKSYGDSKEIKNITYLDANNLYDWVMRQYLPYSGFE